MLASISTHVLHVRYTGVSSMHLNSYYVFSPDDNIRAYLRLPPRQQAMMNRATRTNDRNKAQPEDQSCVRPISIILIVILSSFSFL